MLEQGRLGVRQLSILTILIIAGDMMMVYPRSSQPIPGKTPGCMHLSAFLLAWV